MARRVFFSSLLSWGLSAFAQYSDPTGGYPSWYERSLLTLTDACRVDPTGFRDAYLGSTTILVKYRAADPVFWNYDLNRGARSHAQDMANNCGLQHNSCDNTAWNLRLESYYANKSPYIGENIAAGDPTPMGTMKMWLLDATNNVVPADSTFSSTGARLDGHRANITDVSRNRMRLRIRLSAVPLLLGSGFWRGSGSSAAQDRGWVAPKSCQWDYNLYCRLL